MESAVKVALPAAVAEARLTGTADGLGGGSASAGDVVVRDLRLHKEGACGAGGKKDDICAVKASEPAAWRRNPNSGLCEEICRSSGSFPSFDASNDRGFHNMNPHALNLDLDSKPALQKSCKIAKLNSGHSKKSGLVQMENCKSKPGHDADGVTSELASSSAICNISEKNPMGKQRSSTSRRGDKRNSKVKAKNRSDTFSLKHGLVGFNSAAGGSNFFGIYGLKPDVCDITKYISEQPLDELLRGSCCPSTTTDKGKKAADTNTNLLLSFRKACSVLQPPKVLQVQNCPETDNGSTQNFSTSLVSGSSEGGQTDGDKGDSCVADLPSSEKVQEPESKVKKFNLAESPLYQPRDVLGRLALPPAKDLDSLLVDTIKTSTSKNSTDSRSGKPTTNRTGLMAFPWSNPFSANSKLSSDAAKSSSSRAFCQGGWVKVNSPALDKGSLDLLKDFESLTFNQNLVPSITFKREHPKHEFAPVERVLSTSRACSTSEASSDGCSQVSVAAKTLLDLAAHARGKPSASVRSLKRPSGMAIKASKSKAIDRTKPFFNPPKSTLRPPIPLKVSDDSFPSKKLKLSSDISDRYISNTEPPRKGTLHSSASLPVKPPPGKLFRDSNPSSTDTYASNLLKKPISMKPPRGAERPSHSSLQKFRKLS